MLNPGFDIYLFRIFLYSQLNLQAALSKAKTKANYKPNISSHNFLGKIVSFLNAIKRQCFYIANKQQSIMVVH
ncbi:MAG: hypothetical protein C0591_05650 [Marinilabiliales bacterium]|nr:MAG: hypothetical protein C0591_05650 [Marinilabiliales bacterium]